MAGKIIRDFLIIAGILLFAISTSRGIMGFISEKRSENDSWWGVHKPVNGDLVGMAYLDNETEFHSPRDYQFVKHDVETGRNNLYLWGDSYVWKIPDSAYGAVKSFQFGWRYRDDIAYHLDDAQNNILIIEVAERYIRPYFKNTDIFNHVYKEGTDKNRRSGNYEETEEGINTPGFLNKHINQNMEFNLFNYNFINPVRQWKASMNYHLFSRASGDVVLSANDNQLYLKETVRGKIPENSYYPLDDKELDNIVLTLNTINKHYRQEGFDKIYLSLIPNPATILEPEGYSMLIPRIEQHPRLEMGVISVYDIYKKQTKRIYQRGDTHWNNEGMQIWLNEVNKVLLHEQGPTEQNP